MRGPNNTWHPAGNDKLKPYGFPIHGCMDGFSRKVARLKVAFIYLFICLFIYLFALYL